jgi:hypothetical protein
VQKKPRRTVNTRKKPVGKSAIYLFWFVFFVIILLLFMINWKTIRNTVNNTGLIDRVARRNTGTPAAESPPGDIIPAPENAAPPVVVVVPEKPLEDTITPVTPETTDTAPETVKPPASEPPEPAATPAPKPPEPAATPAPKPPEPAAAPVPKPPGPAVTPAPKPAADTSRPAPKTAERPVYFIKFDEENGVILRSRVSRTLPVTDSPLLDVLNALLRGPTAAEERQKLRSLIPAGTRVLSATVRGSTAYISFSEDFQFNTNGIEGYAAQLQQLVWTITEFSNIQDVQFLIEGRRLDYLGEGIRIGSPLSRNNF